MNKWISVKDRLPENEDYVLCWYEYRAMNGIREGKMVKTYGIGWYYNQSKCWSGEVALGVDARVIAWMPIPKHPEDKY